MVAGEARLRLEWSQTAGLMAVAVNMHRDPKKGRPAKPEDFHPLAGEGSGAPRRDIVKDDISVLKVFLGRASKRRGARANG